MDARMAAVRGKAVVRWAWPEQPLLARKGHVKQSTAIWVNWSKMISPAAKMQTPWRGCHIRRSASRDRASAQRSSQCYSRCLRDHDRHRRGNRSTLNKSINMVDHGFHLRSESHRAADLGGTFCKGAGVKAARGESHVTSATRCGPDVIS